MRLFPISRGEAKGKVALVVSGPGLGWRGRAAWAQGGKRQQSSPAPSSSASGLLGLPPKVPSRVLAENIPVFPLGPDTLWATPKGAGPSLAGRAPGFWLVLPWSRLSRSHNTAQPHHPGRPFPLLPPGRPRVENPPGASWAALWSGLALFPLTLHCLRNRHLLPGSGLHLSCCCLEPAAPIWA